jgi:hypothetical protein
MQMKSTIMKAAATALFLVGMGGILAATGVPEIDGASAGSALALLSGAVLLIRSRKK